jgi:hypothetical protein
VGYIESTAYPVILIDFISQSVQFFIFVCAAPVTKWPIIDAGQKNKYNVTLSKL